MIHTKQKFALLSISRLQSTLAQIQLIEKKLKRDYKKNDAEKKTNKAISEVRRGLGLVFQFQNGQQRRFKQK